MRTAIPRALRLELVGAQVERADDHRAVRPHGAEHAHVGVEVSPRVAGVIGLTQVEELGAVQADAVCAAGEDVLALVGELDVAVERHA